MSCVLFKGTFNYIRILNTIRNELIFFITTQSRLFYLLHIIVYNNLESITLKAIISWQPSTLLYVDPSNNLFLLHGQCVKYTKTPKRGRSEKIAISKLSSYNDLITRVANNVLDVYGSHLSTSIVP